MCDESVKSSRVIILTDEELQVFLERMEWNVPPEDFKVIKALVNTARAVNQVLDEKNASIQSLRALIFGASTEKTKKVFQKEAEAGEEVLSSGVGKEKKKPKGHGRNGSDDFVGAERIPVLNESLQRGDPCPACTKGKVYEMESGSVIRITGQPPLKGKVYEPQKYRCNLCGEVFTADLPEEVGPEKYDEKAGSTIAILKYGSGFPFNRLEKLQESLGIPLPASTQWEIVKGVAEKVAPIYEELIREAAQGDVIYNDDTNMKILGFPKKKTEEVAYG